MQYFYVCLYVYSKNQHFTEMDTMHSPESEPSQNIFQLQVRWVVNGRIVNNNTSPVAFSDQKWIVREEAAAADNIRRWYNLTVTNSG